jgi:exonuclease III
LQLSNKAPDIICLQELWQFPSDVNFNIQGYHPLICKLRLNGLQGGGVGIYVKNVFKFTILQNVSMFAPFFGLLVSLRKHLNL